MKTAALSQIQPFENRLPGIECSNVSFTFQDAFGNIDLVDGWEQIKFIHAQ